MHKHMVNNSFTKTLPADINPSNSLRQVYNACYSNVDPTIPPNPVCIAQSDDLATTLNISKNEMKSDIFTEIFSGKTILEGTTPYAMCYGGHQFGHWAGQLGDGRAINLYEVLVNEKRWALQLKGVGTTPYSRGADGRAVLRSSIREFLCSEAMYHLGVPTTRALSLILSGEDVERDMLYDGNPEMEKGAIVCRVSPSFIRFGNFEIFMSRNDVDTLKLLTDYTITTFFPELGIPKKSSYISFFKKVCDLTCKMIIDWQRVGFVHGVMNTDNMSILGLTIDYGPYGWLDDYNPGWTPNTTDREYRRYRYENQPNIALWNLTQLANALYPLIKETKPLEECLDQFTIDFDSNYLEMMQKKCGLYNSQKDDETLIAQLLKNLELTETDYTLFFRQLAHYNKGQKSELLAPILQAFYKESDITGSIKASWEKWFNTYIERLEKETISNETRQQKMNKTNPKYVLRNYMAQLAIDDANNGDYTLLHDLQNMLKTPYNEQPKYEKWYTKRPDWAREKVGCSMLSCSS